MGDWLDDHSGLVVTLTAASVALLVLSILAVPILVARLPEDYLLEAEGRTRPSHPALRVVRAIGGGILLLAGIAMLVLPGQGLLTIAASLAILEFPGRRRLVTALFRRRIVARVIRSIRRRSGRPPLRILESGPTPAP